MHDTDIRAQLEEERRIIEAATEGPWADGYGGDIDRTQPWKPIVSTEVACGAFCMGGSSKGVIEPTDAAFIAHARTALPVRNAQLAAVLRELDVKRSEPRDDFDRGADAARAMIRRAIEEAGK